MSPRHIPAPRTRGLVIACVVLMALAAFLWHTAGSGPGSGADDLTDGRSASSAAAGPPLTKRPRPSSSDASDAAEMREYRERIEMAEGYSNASREAEEKYDRLRSYLEPGLTLTEEFLTDSGLSQEDFAVIQDMLDRTRLELSARAVGGLVSDGDASLSAEKKGTRVFRLPALLGGEPVPRSVVIENYLLQRMKDPALVPVFRDLRQALDLDPSFGYMGERSCEFRFIPGADTVVDATPPDRFIPDETYQVEIRLYAEGEEEVVYQGTVGLNEFRKLYGNIFRYRE